MALNSISSAENSSMPAAKIVATSTFVESTNVSVKIEPIKISPLATVDTVTLQNKVQNTRQELKTEKDSSEENKKSILARTISDVLFDYNSKGDLRIKFMDSGNHLVYQTPPVLFARIADLIYQPQSTVNTKV